MEIVKNLLKDEPKSIGVILEKIGYAPGVAENPKTVTETEGFKLALSDIGLKEALIAEGIDAKKIAEKINVLLDAKELLGQPDINAIDKGLKHATNIYGITDPIEKPKTINTYNFVFSNPENQADIKALEDKIKARLIQPHDIQTP